MLVLIPDLHVESIRPEDLVDPLQVFRGTRVGGQVHKPGPQLARDLVDGLNLQTLNVRLGQVVHRAVVDDECRREGHEMIAAVDGPPRHHAHVLARHVHELVRHHLGVPVGVLVVERILVRKPR